MLIPDVVLGEADLRPTTARIAAGGARSYPVGAHRTVRPVVVPVDAQIGVPSGRAVPAASHALPVRERRDVAVEPVVAPAVRAGRVPFVEAPYRRRVRMGIDT